LISVLFVRLGPYRTQSAPFNWKYVGQAFRNRGVRLANFGYLGHMWELYAMWAWMPLFILESYEHSGVRPLFAYIVAFSTVGIGSLGCLMAGILADKLGRTTLTIAAMGVSGTCALVAGFLFGLSPLLVGIVCLIWGFAVVADSAQFSASISELAEPEYVGTALTLQTSIGFLLTMVTIRLVPFLESHFGWHVAFAALAIGPVLGILAMAILRRSPDAAKLASGRG
jgi:MFS family permease